MLRFGGRILAILLVVGCSVARGQQAPSTADRPWDASLAKPPMLAPGRPKPVVDVDPAKIYSLPELINIAEHNNPATRVGWENARARATDLGIAQSTLYPTLAAIVLAETTRGDILLGTNYVRQTLETFAPLLQLDYIIFDFGRRTQEVAISRNN